MSTTIRVRTEDLKKGADVLKKTRDRLKAIGDNVNQIARSAPTIQGQFGPRVHEIGRDAASRAEALSSDFSSLSVWLKAKAAAFEGVDQQGKKGMGVISSLLGKLHGSLSYYLPGFLGGMLSGSEAWRDISAMSLEERVDEWKALKKEIKASSIFLDYQVLGSPASLELERKQLRLRELEENMYIPLKDSGLEEPLQCAKYAQKRRPDLGPVGIVNGNSDGSAYLYLDRQDIANTPGKVFQSSAEGSLTDQAIFPGHAVVWGPKYGGGHGHIAIIEEVHDDYVVISDSNWHLDGRIRQGVKLTSQELALLHIIR